MEEIDPKTVIGMKTRLTVLLAALAALHLCGCLWICRVPFPVHEEFSDDGECTNRVWQSCIAHIRERTNAVWRAYPTVWMRCVATHQMAQPIPDGTRGEDLYRMKWGKRLGWIPLTVLWLTVPVDATVDTVILPFDLWSD